MWVYTVHNFPSCCCFLFHCLFSIFLISKYFAMYKRNLLCRIQHKMILYPHSGRFYCIRTEHVYRFFSSLSFIHIEKGPLDFIHNARFTRQLDWRERAHPASSSTEPLMLTLKFSGAKKCIQFIALDHIEQELYCTAQTQTQNSDKHNRE